MKNCAGDVSYRNDTTHTSHTTSVIAELGVAVAGCSSWRAPRWCTRDRDRIKHIRGTVAETSYIAQTPLASSYYYRNASRAHTQWSMLSRQWHSLRSGVYVRDVGPGSVERPGLSGFPRGPTTELAHGVPGGSEGSGGATVVGGSAAVGGVGGDVGQGRHRRPIGIPSFELGGFSKDHWG